MKKIVILVLSLLLLGLVFAGCGETVEPVQDIQLFKDGVSEYKIIYSEDASESFISEVSKLNDAIRSKVGKDLPLQDDFVSEALGISESPCEIVVGDCNRAVINDIKSSLRNEDYIFKVVGTKIVVLGGSEESTINAIGTFRRKCIASNESNDIVIAGDYVFDYSGEYQVDELKLNGRKISEYVITYENTNYTPAIERFNEKITAISGVSLEVKTALKGANDEHRIMFGDCKSGISNGAKVENGSYRIISDGNDVCVVAASAMQADDAVIDIIGKYFPAGQKETFEIKFEAGTDEKIDFRMGDTLKVLTQNLRENEYKEDAKMQIINRMPYLEQIFDEKRPDVICFQEASRDRGNPNNKGKSIYDYVYDSLTPFYSVVCAKRDDDGKGSFTPIFYRADLYNVVASGCNLFTDRFPDSFNKTLSWVVLERVTDGKMFGIINIHFALFMAKYNDENRSEEKGETKYGFVGETDAGLGDTWRQGNAQQVIDKYLAMRESYGADLPVIITGDFNANPDKTSYKMLANYENFADSRLVSTGPSTQNKSSYHAWGTLPKDNTSSLLDHMFVTKDVITVLSHEIIINGDSVKTSDHCPVVCEFEFK